MPTAGEVRLEQAHQRDLATIGAGVTSVVANIALGADPADITTWFFSAIDSITARVQVGYAQSRRSGTDYMNAKATMAGASVDVRTGSLSLAQARTSLEVTGPVAFKRAVGAGANDEEALLSMATQMSGSAQRLAIAGDRDVLEQTIAHGKGVIGYRRVLGGPGCGFCAMLASRGAVYLSRETATTSKSGLQFHDHCRCHVEPMFTHEPDPPDVQRLQRQWRRVTAGHQGQGKAVAWRDYWEQPGVDRSQLRLAAAKAGPPSPVPPPPHAAPGVVVRSGLDAKRTLTGLQEAWAAEAKRITGRVLDVDIPAGTSLQTAKEYAEGVLRGLERFPDAPLRRVGFGQMARDHFAEAGARDITFNQRWANMANRPALLSGMQDDVAGWSQGRNGWGVRGGGNPMATAVHEFGHVIDIGNLGETIHSRALTLATRRAALEGIPVDDLIARDISVYATSDAHELIAEAFADVMLRGQAASPVARDIFDLLEAEYFKAGGRITPAFGTFPAKAAPNLAKMTVADLRALAAQRGVTLPSRALKADIVRALEEAPTPGPAVELGVPYAARLEQLQATSKARVTGQGPRVEQGLFGEVSVQVRGGKSITYKVNRGEDAVRNTDAEELAARVMDAIGARAPAVLRLDDTSMMQEFVDGVRGDKALVNDVARRLAVANSDDGRLIGLGDVLINNPDRGLNNIIIGRDGRVVAIDHGSAFERGSLKLNDADEFSTPLLGSRNDFAPADLAVIRSRIEALRPEFESLGHLDWYEDVQRRLAKVEAGARGTISRLPVIEPGAARWLGTVDLPPAEAERIGALVQAKSRRDILDEIVQLRADGASNRALVNRIRGRAALPNTYDVAPQVDDAFRDELLAAVDNGTIDDVVRRHLAALDNAVAPDVLDAAPIRLTWTGEEYTTSPKLTAAENAAVADYGGTAFLQVNDKLRGLPARVDLMSDAELKRTIANIDSALAKSPLREDVEVWRAFSLTDATDENFAGQATLESFFGGNPNRNLTGFEWTDGAFQSTSTVRTSAEAFGGDVLIRIKVPKGTQGIGLSGAEGASEILLQRGLTLRVVKDHGVVPREWDGVPTRLLDVEVVPVAAEKPLAKRTVAELRALAKERQITLPPKATKARIVEALQAPPLSAAEKAAAERKAVREAARERNRQIEQATGTARLLAEVDELLAKKATAATIRQRLDPALIRPEQVFAGADPAVREALAAALASGDLAKVRAAVTRLTTKAKLKVVGGKAGAKVKFDPDTMESLGAEIADGAPVTVVTRGASVTMPDGTVVQVRKARVTPVVPVPKPVTKSLTRRELAILRAKRDLHVLEARMKALPVGDPARASIQSNIEDARAIIDQKPGPAHYNWTSPSWDQPGGSRILRPPTPSELSAHVDSGVASVIRGATRTDVVQELERQAELTPRSMFEFRGVEDPARFDLTNHANSYAYYDHNFRQVSIKPDWDARRADLERSYASDIATNWYPPTSRTGLEAIMAHEYGHHVTYRLIEAPLIEQRRMIKLLDETFKLDGYLVRQFRREPDIQKVITDFVSGPYATGRVDRYVSNYARKNYQEFFAEVWSEYTTMGDAARPQVKAIGDMMRRMAELSDVVSTP